MTQRREGAKGAKMRLLRCYSRFLPRHSRFSPRHSRESGNPEGFRHVRHRNSGTNSSQRIPSPFMGDRVRGCRRASPQRGSAGGDARAPKRGRFSPLRPRFPIPFPLRSLRPRAVASNFSRVLRDFAKVHTFGKRRGALWTVLIPYFSLFSLKIAIASKFSRVLRDFAKVHVRQAPGRAMDGSHSSLLSENRHLVKFLASARPKARRRAVFAYFAAAVSQNSCNPRLDLFYE